MTNTYIEEVANRLAALSLAVHVQNQSAAPGELCVDSVQFQVLAETLRRYPDARVVQLIADFLSDGVA